MGKIVKEFVRDVLVTSTFRVMTACYQFHGCIIFCVNIVSGGGESSFNYKVSTCLILAITRSCCKLAVYISYRCVIVHCIVNLM